MGVYDSRPRLALIWLLFAALLMQRCEALDSPRSFLRSVEERDSELFSATQKGARNQRDHGVTNEETKMSQTLATFRMVKESLRSIDRESKANGVVGETVSDELTTTIVEAIRSAKKHSTFDAVNRERKLQSDEPLLESILPQIIEIIVFAIGGALVSAFVSAVPGGSAVEELLNVIVQAASGAVVAAIVAALFGDDEVASFLSNAFNRNLGANDYVNVKNQVRRMPGNTTVVKPGGSKDVKSETEVEEDTIGLIISAIVSAIVSAIIGAIIRGIIGAILGILGIGPATIQRMDGTANRTFTEDDLDRVTARLQTNETTTDQAAEIKMLTSILSTIFAVVIDSFSSGSDLDLSLLESTRFNITLDTSSLNTTGLSDQLRTFLVDFVS